MKRILIGTGIGLGVIIVILLGAKAYNDARYFSIYDPGLAFNERIESVEQRETFELTKLYFDARPGEAVPTLLTLPLEFEGRLPIIVFLHGIGQKKEFVTEICTPFNEAGFAMASFDQYSRGEREVPDEGFQGAMAFRNRAWKTVNDTRRFIDYLETRPDIHPERIYLVGASYGAITGSTAAAFDERIKATALVYGAGDMSKMMDAPAFQPEFLAEETGRPLWLVRTILPFAKAGVRYMMAPADPLHYIDRISPRPVLFQNGDRDVLIANDAARAYQERAREPKTIIWYESDHVGLDPVNTERVLRDGIAWMIERDHEVVAALGIDAPATGSDVQQAEAGVEESESAVAS